MASSKQVIAAKLRESNMKTYNFFLRQGQKIGWIKAYTLTQAKAIFAQEYKQYARFVDEVYIEIE